MESTSDGRGGADPAPRRALNLWDATCVVVGAIIGVGIFFNPRDVANVTGSARGALLAWGIGGLVALLGAFTFAELGRLRPLSGGQYHVLRDAYGRVPAFLFVFCNLTAVQGGAVAIIALVCAQNLGVAVHGAAPSAPWASFLAVLLIASLVLVNVLGVRPGAHLQDATVIVKLVTLGALFVVARLVPAAVAAVVPAAGSPVRLGFSPIFSGVTLTLFAYGGWQQALWVAGEIREPQRNVPRAILAGVAIVVAAYLGANWAYLHLLGFDGVRGASALAADAFSVASPGWGRRVAAGAVAVSAFGVLNAQFLTGPRLTWAMANDRQFFAPFARLHRRFATPAAAILLLGGLAIALTLGLGLDRTDRLTTGVVVVDATFFALTGFALPLLWSRAGAADRGPAWIVGAAILFGTLELLAIAGSLLHRDLRTVAWTALAWIAAGAFIWLARFRRVEAVAR